MKAEDKVMDLSKRRGFIWGPSPNIYQGGVSGFYDWGPLGKLLKNKVENIIRRGFNSFGFWEVECPTIMPKSVWSASGHLEKFSDFISRCEKCNSGYRIDELIKEKYPNLKTDGFGLNDFNKIIIDKKIKCPFCGGGLGSVEPYNLMMKTTVGLNQEAYLRPETATTTYLLFPEYYRFFRTKMPFGVFQIGKAYRNEISPRQGVLRTREFSQAEGQYFVTKEDENRDENFKDVARYKIPLEPYGKKLENISLKDAVKKGLIKKKTFAWTLYIAYKIATNMGFENKNIRIRQHNPKELAHYAKDAWDIEVKTSRFGWFEICGVHDRGDYDLKQHSEFSKIKMNVGDAYPRIFEIAFGLERPTYCLLELALREDKVNGEKRDWLSFPIGMAPIDVAVFPLMSKEGMDEISREVFKDLDEEFVCIYDIGGSIGKRYRRMDEVGTSLCITIDHDSIKNKDATIREISTMSQVRVKISDLKEVIRNILKGDIIFKDIK